MNDGNDRRVSSLDDLKAFFGTEPSAVSSEGWAMGVTFIIQDERTEFAWLEIFVAPADAELRRTGYTRASSELMLSVTDATTWHIAGAKDRPRLIVGGGQAGIQQVILELRPVSVEARFDW